MTESDWNKEIVREYLRCIRDRDLDRLLNYLDLAVSLDVPGKTGGSYTGPADIGAYYKRTWELVKPGARMEVRTVVGEGNSVFADTVHHATFAGRVDPLELRVFWLFGLQGRKITGITLSFDTEDVARQAGEEIIPSDEAVA